MTNSASKPIVIVGGGHNGLVSATYLAKAGHKVKVLEAREVVGGAASTTSFAEGYRVSGVAHILYALNPKVCRDLQLESMGLNPGTSIDTIALAQDGNHLTLGRNTVTGADLSQKDIRAYTNFKKEFRSYAKALTPLIMNKPPRLKDMDRRDLSTLAKLGWKLRFGLGTNSMREFLRVGGINIYDVLNEVFDDSRLKGVIAADAVLGHHMGPRTPTTVLTYLYRLWGETHGPQSLPIGGMGEISETLAKAATKAGATIVTGTKVKRIVVDDGRVSAVELESGELIEASIVISNADAKTTFLDLVGTVELDAMFCHRIDTSRTKGNVAKLHLALNALPQFAGLSRSQLAQRLLIAPDMRYVEHAFNHAKYGEYSEQPVLEIVIPSIDDPQLAPEGHHVMSISASFAPYSLKLGWENHRDQFANKIVDLIGRYAPGFSDLIVAKELLTPIDIEAQYNISGGHWHHGELTIDQSFMMRPIHGAAQYDTPIAGLFLCGAAAHPGGGVTGIPGHNAAKRILAMGAGK